MNSFSQQVFINLLLCVNIQLSLPMRLVNNKMSSCPLGTWSLVRNPEKHIVVVVGHHAHEAFVEPNTPS